MIDVTKEYAKVSAGEIEAISEGCATNLRALRIRVGNQMDVRAYISTKKEHALYQKKVSYAKGAEKRFARKSGLHSNDFIHNVTNMNQLLAVYAVDP